MKHILKCQKCNNYTMKLVCCGEAAINPKPAKFSLEDKYAHLRRKAKKEQLTNSELL